MTIFPMSSLMKSSLQQERKNKSVGFVKKNEDALLILKMLCFICNLMKYAVQSIDFDVDTAKKNCERQT